MQQIPVVVLAVLSHPTLRWIFLAVAILVIATAVSRRSLVNGVVALLLLFGSATASVWALQLGWALAALGMLALASGVLWRLVDSRVANELKNSEEQIHGSEGLILTGLALLAAPFANIFLLMPMLRQIMH